MAHTIQAVAHKSEKAAHSKSDLIRSMIRRNSEIGNREIKLKLEKKGLSAYSSEIYRVREQMLKYPKKITDFSRKITINPQFLRVYFF